MKCEVITRTSIVGVSPAFASWAHVGVTDFGEEMRRLRITIQYSLLMAASRTDETACGVSASYLLVIGRNNAASHSAVEAKAGFR